MAKPKLGSGERFAEVEAKAKASGAKNPAAVAAAAGIKKYGKKRMSKMAQAGKKREEHNSAPHNAMNSEGSRKFKIDWRKK